jgi:hypothetical protein
MKIHKKISLVVFISFCVVCGILSTTAWFHLWKHEDDFNNPSVQWWLDHLFAFFFGVAIPFMIGALAVTEIIPLLRRNK